MVVEDALGELRGALRNVLRAVVVQDEDTWRLCGEVEEEVAAAEEEGLVLRRKRLHARAIVWETVERVDHAAFLQHRRDRRQVQTRVAPVVACGACPGRGCFLRVKEKGRGDDHQRHRRNDAVVEELEVLNLSANPQRRFVNNKVIAKSTGCDWNHHNRVVVQNDRDALVRGIHSDQTAIHDKRRVRKLNFVSRN